FLVEPKWLEPSMPIVFVLVGAGVVVAGSLAGHRRWLVMTLITAALVLRWSPLLAFPLRHVSASEEIEQRWAGEWVRRHVGPGTTLMSRGPATAYHAAARWVPLPLVDLAGLRAVAE